MAVYGGDGAMTQAASSPSAFLFDLGADAGDVGDEGDARGQPWCPGILLMTGAVAGRWAARPARGVAT